MASLKARDGTALVVFFVDNWYTEVTDWAEQPWDERVPGGRWITHLCIQTAQGRAQFYSITRTS